MTIRIHRGRRASAGEGAVEPWRLFCFPYAGAGAAVFRQWSDHLPAHFELCIPCLPGRDARIDEPPVSDMSSLVSGLAQEMLEALGPRYAFFGHSMGAFIAFDLAHALSERGRPPAHLFVSAQRAPRLPYPAQPIFALPDDEFLAGVLARYHSIPKPLLEDQALRAILLRTLRADFTLVEDYRYRAGRALPCPVTAFGGADDPGIAPEQLEAWSQETTGSFRLHLLAGGHFFLQEKREELLSIILADLDVL
jgi:medium-chain acyl-[acyl-carrier-protein] hydrolase